MAELNTRKNETTEVVRETTSKPLVLSEDQVESVSYTHLRAHET